MPAQSISLNNSYNEKLRNMLYDMEHVDIIKRQPEMLGGGSHEYQRHLLPGNSGQYPPVHMLAEYKMMGGALLMERTVGGRQNKVRKQGVAKALRTLGRAVKPLGKNLKPVKKAMTERAVKELEGNMPSVEAEIVEEEMNNKMNNKAAGGKISRMRKANKWTDYAEKTAYKALELAKAAKGVGGVSRMKKANKWTDFAEKTGYKAIDLAKSAKGVGGAKLKRANPRAVIVKKVMAEKGLSMIEASKYVKANGLY